MTVKINKHIRYFRKTKQPFTFVDGKTKIGVIVNFGYVELKEKKLYELYEKEGYKVQIYPKQIRQRIGNKKYLISFKGLKDKFLRARAIQGNIRFFSYKFKKKRQFNNQIDIIYRDYETLNERRFLNDKIVNFYLKILEDYFCQDDRIHFCNTYYYTLTIQKSQETRSKPKKPNSLDIFTKSILIVPINEKTHWSLIIIKNIDKMKNVFKKGNDESVAYPEIFYLDSLYSENDNCIRAVKEFLFNEYYRINKQEFNSIGMLTIDDIILLKGKLIKSYSPNVSKQTNIYDCGIYMLTYAELFVHNPTFFFRNAENGNVDNALNEWFNREFVEDKRRVIQEMMLKTKNGDSNAIYEYFEKEKNIINNIYKNLEMSKNKKDLS